VGGGQPEVGPVSSRGTTRCSGPRTSRAPQNRVNWRAAEVSSGVGIAGGLGGRPPRVEGRGPRTRGVGSNRVGRAAFWGRPTRGDRWRGLRDPSGMVFVVRPPFPAGKRRFRGDRGRRGLPPPHTPPLAFRGSQGGPWPPATGGEAWEQAMGTGGSWGGTPNRRPGGRNTGPPRTKPGPVNWEPGSFGGIRGHRDASLREKTASNLGCLFGPKGGRQTTGGGGR